MCDESDAQVGRELVAWCAEDVIGNGTATLTGASSWRAEAHLASRYPESAQLMRRHVRRNVARRHLCERPDRRRGRHGAIKVEIHGPAHAD
jgi:hypothetical protein